ncbi:MAG: hypothetical protein M0P61_00365 [Ignavibacteriaceae bacterium]|jgi:hypothetical protein|nr:hypothetical protein [Ignavibacteriaceae bacterium]
MKTIKKGISQLITLDQTLLGSGKHVYLTMIGEDGSVIKNSSAADIKDLSLSYNATSSLYEAAVTVASDEPEQYVRLFFYATDANVENKYYPEDAKLEAVAGIITTEAEIVPVQFFIDYVLASSSRLDPAYEAAITAFSEDRAGLRSYLKSAQDTLEKQCELYFTERTKTENRDNYFEKFSMNLWQIQVYNPPINDLTSVKIKYGNTELMGIGVDLFTFDRMTGIIEFLPLPTGGTAGLYTLLLGSLSALGLSVLTGGALERIPNFFEVTYKTGLVYAGADPFEVEGIRQAICRRAFLSLVHHVDPAARVVSESESIDGVASSISSGVAKVITELKQDEVSYLNGLRQKYGKNFNVVIG